MAVTGDQPASVTAREENCTARVIKFPTKSRPARTPSLEWLEDAARRATDMPYTGEFAGDIAIIRRQRDVAFEACAQVRLDGRLQAIEVALRLLYEMDSRLATLSALQLAQRSGNATRADPVPRENR